MNLNLEGQDFYYLSSKFVDGARAEGFTKALNATYTILIFLNWEIWPWQRLSQCLYHSVESKKECTQDKSKYKTRVGDQCSDQTTKTLSDWASAELLDLIEAVPYHEQFIHTFEEALPRG